MEHQHASMFSDPRFWVGVAFVIFFIIFGRKFWGILSSALDKRGVQIRAELDEAARLRHEAEQLLIEARARREVALQEADAMLASAREEAVRVASEARKDAAIAAERREKLAMDRISAAEKAAIMEVRLAAADIASRAAAKVIAESFGPEADSSLIDHAIQGLPAALAGRRAA